MDQMTEAPARVAPVFITVRSGHSGEPMAVNLATVAHVKSDGGQGGRVRFLSGETRSVRETPAEFAELANEGIGTMVATWEAVADLTAPEFDPEAAHDAFVAAQAQEATTVENGPQEAAQGPDGPLASPGDLVTCPTCGASLKYEGDYGAPGIGQAWRCTGCGHPWGIAGGSMFDPTEGVPELTEADVQ